MDLSSHRPNRIARHVLVVVVVPVLLAAVLGGCGNGDTYVGGRPATTFLAAGDAGRAPDLAAARLARRFARAYAAAAYRRSPTDIAGASAAVRRAVRAGAGRVPVARRTLHPRLLDLVLSRRPTGSLVAIARVGDGRFPPFTVGFSVSRRSGRWLVTSVSLPD